MACKSCVSDPVIILPGTNKPLCKGCFSNYFERKVQKTMTKYRMIRKGDHVGVAVSGGKDSSALLHILSRMQKHMGIFELSAILVDEGIDNYRSRTKIFAEKVCKKYGVNLVVVEYKKEFGSRLDAMIKKSDLNPCMICGVLRRYALNKYAKQLGFTKLATGHNLDDEAQSILMNLLKNNSDILPRGGPVTGLASSEGFVTRVKPFYFLSEKEVATYSFIHSLLDSVDCPYHTKALREDVRNLLNGFAKKYPGSKHSLVNSFVKMLPALRDGARNDPSALGLCRRCGEPSAKEICKCCELIGSIS